MHFKNCAQLIRDEQLMAYEWLNHQVKPVSTCETNCTIIIDFAESSDMKVFGPIFRDQIEGGEDHLNIFPCTNSGELDYQLERILDLVRSRNVKPMILFDGHGVESGLYFGEKLYDEKIAMRCGKVSFEDVYPWRKLWEKLRVINRETANNLVLLFATCFSANLFQIFNILSVPAYYYAVAPKGEVKAGELQLRYGRFIRSAFANDDFSVAMAELDSVKFSAFHSETYFYYLVIKFMGELRGKNRQKSLEEFVTSFKYKYPHFQEIEKSRLRSVFKSHTANRDAIFQKLKNIFLMADDPRNKERFGWSIDDISKFFDEKNLSVRQAEVTKCRFL